MEAAVSAENRLPQSRSLLWRQSSRSLWSAALALWLAVAPAQAEENAWAFDVAHAHIAENYAWPTSKYHLRIRYQEDGVVALHVHHKEDERRNSQGVMWAGGGKSFEIYLDVKTRRVIEEVHFQ